MDRSLESETMTSHLIRSPEDELVDDWSNFTPDERMEAVWTLTKACLGWNKEGFEEPRLDRSVTRVIRATPTDKNESKKE